VLNLLTRRRAERFAHLLDAHSSGGRRRAGDREMAGLLRTATALSSVSQPDAATPDPEFTDRLRTRLLSVMEVQGIAQPAAPRRTFRVPRRVVIAGPALAGVLALSGVGAASHGAVPGDTLYGVKRSTESAQLTLASTDVNRGRLFLDFARTRMSEARAVVSDPAALNKSLDDMDDSSRNGARLLGAAAVERQDRAPLDALDGFVLTQRSQLRVLSESLQPGERARVVDSFVLLEQIQQRSLDLRGSLLCTTGYAGDSRSDVLGPLPQHCAALQAGTAPGVGNLPPVTTSPIGMPIPGLPSLVVPPGTPTLPGLGGTAPTGTGLATPSFPGGGIPGLPGYQQGEAGPGGLFGTVTDTVGGVVGGLFGPFVGAEPSASPSPSGSPTPTPSDRSRLRDLITGGR
jgi:hypothetical protein